MKPLKALGLGFAFMLVMTASPAAAEQINLGKHDAKEIKADCKGGSYIQGGGAWSCFKKCDGGTCSVSCDKDGCTGSTPDRTGPTVTGRQAVIGALNGRIAR